MKAPKTPKAKAEEGMLQWPEPCLRCGHKMVETHCKIFCPSCGYMRDCNDQW
ncbi:hypothetical protein HYY73_02275 [Candidatus Woesearchaeota archaeon]|nr:hypothetical protein [Candidatus Woesearchaeota archaeon]